MTFKDARMLGKTSDNLKWDTKEEIIKYTRVTLSKPYQQVR